MRPTNVLGASGPGILLLNVAETGTKSRAGRARLPRSPLAEAGPPRLLQTKKWFATTVSSRDTLSLNAGRRKLRLQALSLLVDEEEPEEEVEEVEVAEEVNAAVMDSERLMRRKTTEVSVRPEMMATVF